jgi:hypothetical protein
MERTKCPSTDEWINVIHLYNAIQYYSAIRKNEMSFATHIDKPGGHYVK